MFRELRNTRSLARIESSQLYGFWTEFHEPKHRDCLRVRGWLCLRANSSTKSILEVCSGYLWILSIRICPYTCPITCGSDLDVRWLSFCT